MFTGIDEVDWASMGHAYGDASDVPELLRGLASSDAAERETALDGMYGAVHHQGDVYDSTVACIPFLFELVATDGLPGRGELVELLCGIDGDGRDVDEMDFWSNDEDEYQEWAATLARAEADTRAGSGLLLGLLDDSDAQLRGALPKALVQLHDDPHAVFEALRGRLAAEQDAEVLRALAAGLGELAVRRGEFGERAAGALRTLLAPGEATGGAGLRLAALVQLARCAPGRLPEDTVEVAADVMREAREEGTGPARRETSGLRTPTMISYLRELRASHRQGMRAPWATELLAELHRALDDRAAERFALLEDQLRSPDWGQRRAAIDMSGLLLSGWRGPHEESVRLLGEQMRETEPRLVRWAAKELRWLHAIGAPAADALAERVAEGPGLAVQASWDETSYGAALSALAAQGDARAVPGLLDVLPKGHVPDELPGWVERLGPRAAAPLTGILAARLARTGPGASPYRTGHLLEAVAATGSAEALVPVLRVLRMPRSGTGPARGAALRALARLGTLAREAEPELRELLGECGPQQRADVAAALWAVGGGTEPVLPVLSEELGAEHWARRHTALRLVGRMGPEAAPLLPALRTLVAAPEENGGWIAGALAVALWEAGRDAAEAMPVLRWAWSEHHGNRPEVAGAWARAGSAAAGAVPVLRQELAAARRHNNTGGEGRMRYRCADDELLLSRARTVLAACGSD